MSNMYKSSEHGNDATIVEQGRRQAWAIQPRYLGNNDRGSLQISGMLMTMELYSFSMSGKIKAKVGNAQRGNEIVRCKTAATGSDKLYFDREKSQARVFEVLFIESLCTTCAFWGFRRRIMRRPTCDCVRSSL